MTNLLSAAENLAGPNWSELLDAEVTGNTSLAPDGTLTADKIGDDGVYDNGQVAIQQSAAGAINTQYALAGFFKPGGEDWVYFRPLNFGSLSLGTYFNLAAGSIGTAGADVDAVYITGPYENDFYRAEIIFTTDGADATGNIRLYVADSNEGHTGLAIDGTNNIIGWGLTLHAGSRAPPYTSVAGILVSAGSRNYIAVTRRTAAQMNVKQRMAKPKRGLFRD